MMKTRCNCWVRDALQAGEDLRGFGNEVHSRSCPLYQPARTIARRDKGIARCEEGQIKYQPRWVKAMNAAYAAGRTQ